MERETELFVESVFRENRSVIDLLAADYTFLNERLAKHYGIPNVRGSYFRRVTLPANSPRGGLLGHGSVLTITSSPRAPRRCCAASGCWRTCCRRRRPAPANIPALETKGAAPGELLTMREAMTKHRASPSCASCHARMDPIGFAMEHSTPSDAGAIPTAASDRLDGRLPDGTKFDGVVGLKRELLRHPDQFAGTVAERLLMYAVGRNLHTMTRPPCGRSCAARSPAATRCRRWCSAS